VLAMKNLNFSLDFPVAKLKQAHGEVRDACAGVRLPRTPLTPVVGLGRLYVACWTSCVRRP
jgi:hypothetical protein